MTTSVASPAIRSVRPRRAPRPGGRRAISSRTLVLGGIAVTAFGSTAALARLVSMSKTRGLDHGSKRLVRRMRSDTLDLVAHVVTELGEPVVELPLAILAGLAIVRHSRSRTDRRDGSGLDSRVWVAASSPTLAGVVAVMAHHGLKLFFKRRRPIEARLHGNTESSFPSGHTSVSTAAIGASAYALAREGLFPVVGLPVAIAIPCAVGFSRVYRDKHWASECHWRLSHGDRHRCRGRNSS